MDVLHLTITKKWFDMIASGEKKEEYRDKKVYWETRLFFNSDSGQPRRWDYIEFKNGYNSTSPKIKVRFEGISIGLGLMTWGAELDREYYIIQLGEVIK